MYLCIYLFAWVCWVLVSACSLFVSTYVAAHGLNSCHNMWALNSPARDWTSPALQGGFLITGPPGKSLEPFSGNHRKAYFNKMRRWELRRRKDLGSREQKKDHRGKWTHQWQQSKSKVHNSHVAPWSDRRGGNREESEWSWRVFWCIWLDGKMILREFCTTGKGSKKI